MKIWITGANGLVGQAVRQLCQNQNINFVATGHADGDISSLAQIKSFFHSHPGITHIINCAGYTRVDEAEHQKEEAFKSNTLGPENLGILAREKGLKLVHVSTDYVFDSEANSPMKEHDPCSPSSVYGQTKHEGEMRLLEEFPRACILRTSWVFGPGGKNFISSIWDKLHQEKKMKIVHDQINRITYVKDLAKALLALLCHEGIYHFANEGITSRYEVAQQMKQLLQEKGNKITCEEIDPTSAASFPTVARRPRFSVLDTQKIEKISGISPRPWEEALKEYIDETLS